MAWPDWIEELKRRYLADEANVFVLHGDVATARFDIDGEMLDCVEILRRFLSRSRPIVGVFRPWPHPSRLQFVGVHDRNRFENLVKAHDLLEGRTDALRETHPPEALARMWRALHTTGTDQAYVLLDADRLLPSHRRSVTPIPGAPALADWPTDPSLRRSNNLLVLLTESEANVRPAFLDITARIAVRSPAAPAAVPHAEVADVAPERPVPAPPPPVARRTPVPSVPPEGPDVDDVRRDLEPTLLRTVLTHPVAHRPARLPVMDAVAQVIAQHRPAVWGTLQLGLDDEGGVAVTGTGARRFLEAWRSDIALDAAAGMLLNSLDGTYSDQQPPPLDNTALTALCKRIVKVIQRL